MEAPWGASPPQMQGRYRGGWGGQSFGVGVLGRTARPDLAPPVLPLPIHASTPPNPASHRLSSRCPLFFIHYAVGSLPHPHIQGGILTLQTEPVPLALEDRRLERLPADCRAPRGSGLLATAVPEVALPAGEEPRLLPDLRLLFPRRLSWGPSPICIEGLVLPTSGRPHPGQGESSVAWRR